MAQQAQKQKAAARGQPARGGKRAAGGLPLAETGIEEGLRHCRRIALDIGAEGFGVLLSVPSAGRSLSVVLDCDLPLPSPYLAAFLDVHEAEISRHALATSAPLWWHAPGQAPDAFAALPWGVRLASHGGVVPGIAFPCYPERGPHGLVLFWGPKLAVGPDAMPDIHARCFALFEAICLLRGGEAKRPQMSKREIECLELTAQGRTSNGIAKQLGLSIHTTNQHLEEAGRKLNSVNRIHAVAKALRLGLIE